MNTSPQPTYQYYFGGTLRVDDRTYVTRQADRDFYAGLKAGEFCYVLNSRQMGKSSLGVRTMVRLKAEGIACAFIDITAIVDGNITEDKWYAGLMRKLVDSFEIGGDFNLKNWLNDRNFLSSIQRFSEFIETVVLADPNRNFVVFIDEIDSILRLGAPADDFFAYIRSCWNERATKPAYDRLTFAILGVAEPSDLIQERQRTPFNIGRAIELTGFSFDEAEPLLEGLIVKSENPPAVLQEILNWTGGQPFLTQKVCQSIAQLEISIEAGSEVEIVGDTIRDRIIDNWEMHDKPEHLATIRNRIFGSNEKQTTRLLGIYQIILLDGKIDADRSREQIQLRLTGLVVKSDNKLKIYNQIYQEIFDRDWLKKALMELRPYAESLNAWVGSGYEDESRLLRGRALQNALIWSEDRNLSTEDYRYLTASQAAALEIEKQTNKILAAANQEAEFSLSAARKQVEELQEQERQTKQRLVKIEQRVNLADVLLVSKESQAALLNHQELEAMVQAVRAGRKLQELDKSVWKKDAYLQAILALQQANYQVLEQNRFQGHTDVVRSASFSLDGTKIVTASLDKTARVWDARGQLLVILTGHTDFVMSANFSPNSTKIVTASGDKTARVWDVHGMLLATLAGHTDAVRSASFSPDGTKIVTASLDKTARVCDVRGKLLVILTGHTDAIGSASFSPDSTKIVTVSLDKTARVWDVLGTLLATLAGHTDAVRSASFSPDSTKIVTASGDKTARVWDVYGMLLATLAGHTEAIGSASFSPDGTKIVTASGDKTARVWDVYGMLLATLAGHENSVSSASFSTDGRKIVTVSEDKTARVWNVRGVLLATLTGHTEAIGSASFSPDGTEIITASGDKTARVWDVESATKIVLSGHTDSVESACFSTDGRKIATAAKDKTVRVWDIYGTLLVTLSGHENSIRSISFSTDSRKIVTAAEDKTARVWDIDGTLLVALTGHTSFVTSASFNSDGTKIVTASLDKIARVWDIDGTLLSTLAGHTSSVISASFNSDGTKIVTAAKEKTARVWDIDGTLLSTLAGHTEAVTSASFSPDGRKIITTSLDKTARVWDVHGTPISTLTGHTNSVTSANFSTDSRKIVTASGDKTARVWDIDSTLLGTLTGHTSFVTSASFSPDGSKIVTASGDKTARVWGRIDSLDTDLDRLLTRSCHKLHDYLSTNPTVKPEDRELCGIKKVAQ